MNTGKRSRNEPSSSEEEPEIDDEERRTLFCANLSDRVTEEILYELFLQSGPLESVRIPKDNTGRQRNFGFVTFVHQCSVPYALTLYEGVRLFNRPLTIRSRISNNNTNHARVPHPPPVPDPSSQPPSKKRRSDESSMNHHDNSALRHGNAAVRRGVAADDDHLSPRKNQHHRSQLHVPSAAATTAQDASSQRSNKNPFKLDLDVDMLSRLGSNMLPPPRKETSRCNLEKPWKGGDHVGTAAGGGGKQSRYGSNQARDTNHPYKRPDKFRGGGGGAGGATGGRRTGKDWWKGSHR